MSEPQRFLRNAWYVGALSSEIEKPLGRELLGQRMVLFRTAGGKPAALSDICPHRYAPLSRGRVEGDSIECGYHGLRSGASGKCTHNPHGDGHIPSRAQVASWPCLERYGFVWVWPGDAARADPALVPPYPFNEDSKHFAVVYGYIDVAANYQLLVDNLLDLSDVEFLHPMFKQSGGVGAHKTSLTVEGTSVIANRLKPNVDIQGLARLFWTSPSKKFNGRSNMRWMPPSSMIFDLGGTECGRPVEEGVCLPNAHLITPASQFRSHYFWSIARNRKIDDPEAGGKLQEVTQRIFTTEDIPMVEDQQRNMGAVEDILALRPLTLEPDGPAVRARMILADLIRAETEAVSAAAE